MTSLETIYNPSDGAGSVGVEFVVTSVSTTSSPINIGQQIIQLANPHMKFIDLAQKGYLIVDLTDQKAQSDWYFVSDITEPSFTSSWGSWLLHQRWRQPFNRSPSTGRRWCLSSIGTVSGWIKCRC